MVQPAVLVIGYHKGGSGALAKFLRAMASVNSLGFQVSDDGASIAFREEVCLLRNVNYLDLQSYEGRGVNVIRNPLSIVWSAYWSHLKSHPTVGSSFVWDELVHQRRLLQKATIEEGLWLTVRFLEREAFHGNRPGPLYCLKQWHLDDIRFLTQPFEDGWEKIFEAVLVNTAGGKAGLLPPDFGAYSFSRLSGGRAVGEVDSESHYRSGNQEEWRAGLTEPIIDYLRSTFHQLLADFYPSALLDHWPRNKPGEGFVPKM